MSTIGDTLKQYISEQDKQSALASRWLELWRTRFPKKKDWSPNTVESNLSRLLKSDPQGIRFFFEDDARSDLLFEVLGVPTDQQAAVQVLADSGRQPGPRVVVDISAWPSRGEALTQLFVELRQRLPQNSPLQPVALVLTELQYEQLPRSYDEQLAQRTLIVRKVEGATDAPRVTAELAGDAALVLAPWEFFPHERWLAADFTNNTLLLEPPDGLAVFAEHGALPSIPAVEHPLERICESAPLTFKELSPRQRRLWTYTLASEARTSAALAQNDGLREPSHRLAFARQIGAAATSTARERLDHELAQLSAQVREHLGVPVEALEPAAHAERIARAELRPIPISAWRCGDEIHLLHAEPPVAHPRIIVHHPVPVVPALTRLVDHVSAWSVEDFEADPMLARAVETLDPEGREREAFLHARGTFLWNDLRPTPPAAVSCVRWADELRAVFAADPPPASLRIRLPKPADAPIHDYLAFADDGRVCAALKAPSSLVWPRSRRTLIAERGREVLQVFGRVLPSLRPWALDKSAEASVELRDSRGQCFRIFADPEDCPQYHHYSTDIPGLWLPKITSLTGDVDVWLDCLERSSAFGRWEWGHSESCEKLLRTTGKLSFDIVDVSEIKGAKIEIAAGTWMAADNLLAQCWLAFRAALERPLSVSTGSGVVCSLGAGICAHLVVTQRHHGSPRGTIAAFDASVAARLGVVATPVVDIDFTPLWTHSAVVDNRAANFGVRVPSRLILRTSTVSASITFLASPLLQASTPAMIGAIAPIVAAQLAEEEEEEARAAYDDD